MSDEMYDDGLVHSHSWCFAQDPARREARQVADVSAVRTPSTTAHDDHHFCD